MLIALLTFPLRCYKEAAFHELCFDDYFNLVFQRMISIYHNLYHIKGSYTNSLSQVDLVNMQSSSNGSWFTSATTQFIILRHLSS